MSYGNWRQLRSECEACQKCGLGERRRHMVFGEGNIHAGVMLIGEGPGQIEDETGRPFVGPSGELLQELLEKNGLKRQDLYICNVVKCRPPGNRDPRPEEIQACIGYLRAQVAFVKPKIIVALGRFAALQLLGDSVRIMRDHGRPYHVKSFTIIPTFHPAALLHNPANVPMAEADFQIIAQEVRKMQHADAGNS